MAEFNVPKHGTICWRELATKDLKKAKSFYQDLIGWTLEQSKLATEIEYPEIHVDGRAIGGMMEINEKFGPGWEHIPAHWMTYIAVNDVDDSVEKIKENGGSILVPPFDAGPVGRMAAVRDPAGAVFSVIQFAAP